MNELLLKWLELKHLNREGWVRAGLPTVESVASHSWSMGLLAMTFCPSDHNLEKVLKMCIVHDLAEIIVGDITPQDNIQGKAELEHRAFEDIAPQFLSLFEEYEAGISKEAQFVKQMDKLDMALQSRKYEEVYNVDLSGFRVSADRVLKDTVYERLYRDF
jgi:putative hydrolase of HD superfamily